MNQIWIDPLAAVLGLAAGFAVGFLYFRGLWRATTIAVEHERPIASMLVRFVFRVSVTLAAFGLVFYLSAIGGIAMLVGFMLARHRAVSPVKREIACN